MGVDINDLAPWAQKQALGKLRAQMARKGAEMPAEAKNSKLKYNNTPTDAISVGGKQMRFASKKEAERYDNLLFMLQAGQIEDLRLQPQFTLQESYITPDGERVRAIRYVADFSYKRNGKLIVEDVKSTATRTKQYKMKRKMMLDKYGIERKKPGLNSSGLYSV